MPPASISVHYSPLSAAQTSSRSSSAPWSSYSVCIFRNTSSVPHYCTHRPPQGTQRLRQQAPHPKSALRCEVYGMHRHTGREGVYVYLLHNVGNISRTTICKFSSIMSVAPLAPACMHYTDAFTSTRFTMGGLPQFPNVPTLAVQTSGSSRNTPPRLPGSGPTLTHSFRRYCATPTTDLPGLQERQLSTRPHTIVVHPKSRYLSMRSSKWAAATRAGGSSVTS